MHISHIFKERRSFEIFVLAIISGMPFAILVTSIPAWLSDDKIGIEIITTFAIAKLFYNLKFIWSPIVNFFSVPFLVRFGQRKSWMLLCVIALTIIMSLMSHLHPSESLREVRLLAILLGFFSATYDITYDAFRIERFTDNQSLGAANSLFGYRIGLLITGAGALNIAHVVGNWPETFKILSYIFAASIGLVLITKEDPKINSKIELDHYLITKFFKSTSEAFRNFLKHDKALLILLAIVLYKVGEAMLSSVIMPFYLYKLYPKNQIAYIGKLYGFIATISGTYIAVVMIKKIGYLRGLIIGGLIQSFAHVAFIWLNHQDTHYNALLSAITFENIANGMGSAALITYLSHLCNKEYSVLQYALLSSLASIANNTITVFSGRLVKIMGWDNYFIFTIFLGLPAIAILVYLDKMQTKSQNKNTFSGI